MMINPNKGKWSVYDHILMWSLALPTLLLAWIIACIVVFGIGYSHLLRLT